MSPAGESVDFMLRNSNPEENKQGGGEREEKEKIPKPSKQLPNLKAFHFVMKNISIPSHEKQPFAVKIFHGNFI